MANLLNARLIFLFDFCQDTEEQSGRGFLACCVKYIRFNIRIALTTVCTRNMIPKGRNTMKNYTEIDTPARMEKILTSLGHFHDSITKELHIENLAFASSTGAISMNLQFNVRLLLHLQSRPYAAEFVFYRSSGLQLHSADEHSSGHGTIREENLPFNPREVTLDIEDTRIIAERLYYRPRPDWTGPHLRFHGPIPSPEAIPAVGLERNWRQCSSCCDAWEEAFDAPFAYCPSCGLLTELDGTGPDVDRVPRAPIQSPPRPRS